jgi:hypothetical protein
MMDIEKRIDAHIEGMSAEAKRRLVDTHFPPAPGAKSSDEQDEKYLRFIVSDIIKEHDARVEAHEKSGVAALEARVRKLESILGPRGDTLLSRISEQIGKGLRVLLPKAGYMRHVGTWVEDKTYTKGDCVVADGGTWLALADASAGARPGKALEWRLIARESK